MLFLRAGPFASNKRGCMVRLRISIKSKLSLPAPKLSPYPYPYPYPYHHRAHMLARQSVDVLTKYMVMRMPTSQGVRVCEYCRGGEGEGDAAAIVME